MSAILGGYLLAVLNAVSIYGRTFSGLIANRPGRYNVMMSSLAGHQPAVTERMSLTSEKGHDSVRCLHICNGRDQSAGSGYHEGLIGTR